MFLINTQQSIMFCVCIWPLYVLMSTSNYSCNTLLFVRTIVRAVSVNFTSHFLWNVSVFCVGDHLCKPLPVNLSVVMLPKEAFWSPTPVLWFCWILESGLSGIKPHRIENNCVFCVCLEWRGEWHSIWNLFSPELKVACRVSPVLSDPGQKLLSNATLMHSPWRYNYPDWSCFVFWTCICNWKQFRQSAAIMMP